MLLPHLIDFVKPLLSTTDRLADHRRFSAEKLVQYIQDRKETGQPVDLVFICTHNSRRSIFGQVWAAVAAHHFGIDGVSTWSGGTEVTAFNPNARAALLRAGFEIESPDGDGVTNPVQFVRFAEAVPPLKCFSKKYSDASNPSSGFAAVMTCTDAEKNCPLVPGADLRVAMPYEDPRLADGTMQQEAAYDDCCKVIAQEMLWIFSRIRKG